MQPSKSKHHVRAAEARWRRAEKRAAAERAAGVPDRPGPLDCRLPFDWTFACDGVARDVRQWRVFRDGEPWMCAGLERFWRTMQREMNPALGWRHWRQGRDTRSARLGLV